jgi:predicted esterase
LIERNDEIELQKVGQGDFISIGLFGNRYSIMKHSRFIVQLVLTMWSFTAEGQKLADPILLWPEGAPGATGITDEDKPALVPFIPEAVKRNGAAILVVPGGGFTTRATDHEGVLVAQWLKDHGITAFLLRYRLRPLYSRTDWVKDGQRGMQYIRSHADEYHVSIDRVGAVGFSAGANLIADMTFNSLPGKINAMDLLERFPARPDFLILAYGSMKMPAMDPLIMASLPPVFMFGTAEDAGAMNGMVDLYGSLLRAKVPVEAHFFSNGEHGSGFAIGDPILGEWPKLMHTWLAVGGFLTDKPQLSLSGIVKLDGAPLVRGMVILTPIDMPEAPPVVVYMNNTGTGELGRFSVSRDHGPIAGKYRVEVRQDATRWMSNSRDPFMISMMNKQRDCSLT